MSDEKEVDLTGTDRPTLAQVTSEGSIPAATEGATPTFTTGGSRSASEDNVAKPRVMGRRISAVEAVRNAPPPARKASRVIFESPPSPPPIVKHSMPALPILACPF
ncbi:hypothetical protein WR25_23563 [Diploscapter pachys]|uniref:Uncharacterized protein n=1 Tax=Diploscapter pachys TaxID=2018661 RepID=A0A2A2KJZ0_9BILA|nr:hypothetical protein WR25_23563 [Diploscapter pachys]